MQMANKNAVKNFEQSIKQLESLVKEMESGDLLALLGKGRENFQNIKGEKIPYSDFNIIQSYL